VEYTLEPRLLGRNESYDDIGGTSKDSKKSGSDISLPGNFDDSFILLLVSLVYPSRPSVVLAKQGPACG
jgi:hypothetical protein